MPSVWIHGGPDPARANGGRQLPNVSEILPRVLQVCADLSAISEAPAARALDEVSRPGSSEAPPPPGFYIDDDGEGRIVDPSLLDGLLEDLEVWLSRAEFERDRVRYRAPAREPETHPEWRDRVLGPEEHGGYEGFHYRDAAQREACSPTLIRETRRRGGRDPMYGRLVPHEGPVT